jgi:hypothetical protein
MNENTNEILDSLYKVAENKKGSYKFDEKNLTIEVPVVECLKVDNNHKKLSCLNCKTVRDKMVVYKDGTVFCQSCQNKVKAMKRKKDKNYEPKNMSSWYRLGGFSQSLGECHRCSKPVNETNGTFFTNLDREGEPSWLLHKKCFEIDKELYVK